MGRSVGRGIRESRVLGAGGLLVAARKALDVVDQIEELLAVVA
jgi:hypothetical protein